MPQQGYSVVVAITFTATLLATACGRETEPAYHPTATVEEIMRTLIDPSADAIWDAVVTDATVEGIIETRPETADDWETLRRHTVTLAESANLLLMEGRRVAAPESRSELPGIDLHPDAIQALMVDDWKSWITLARGLHDVSLTLLDAIEARDLNAFLVAGTELDVACENCHSRYWYPGSADPRQAEPGP